MELRLDLQVRIATMFPFAANNSPLYAQTNTSLRTLTTPAALDFHGRLFIMQERGCVDYFCDLRIIAVADMIVQCTNILQAGHKLKEVMILFISIF